MTPSFLEHWAQRDFGGFDALNRFEGMVIMAIYWLGSMITAHQFFKGVP
jgi:hypothetical protein